MDIWAKLGQGALGGVEQFTSALVFGLLLCLAVFVGWKLALRMIERSLDRVGKKIAAVPKQALRSAGSAAGSALDSVSTAANDAFAAVGPVAKDAAAKGSEIAGATVSHARAGIEKAAPVVHDTAAAAAKAAVAGVRMAADRVVVAAPAIQAAAGAFTSRATQAATSVAGNLGAGLGSYKSTEVASKVAADRVDESDRATTTK
jgi:hypothetical protein